MNLRRKLDKHLLDLAWSLWTELGVAGVIQKHRHVLIDLEALILLTCVLVDEDPRLRDESLDWCSKYHHFVSISRLKSILKDYHNSLDQPFSAYTTTLNQLSKASWPVLIQAQSYKLVLSRKSCLKPLESPALLNIRIRSLFTTGARADLLTFLLTNPKKDFSAFDFTEIGYTKRNFIEILDELTQAHVFEKFMVKNQYKYRFIKNDQLKKVLEPIPEYCPSWRFIFEILLPLRECIKKNEMSSESTQVIEIRNFLINYQEKLQRLHLQSPSFQTDFSAYLISFEKWLLEITRQLAQADFPNKNFLTTH